jgi:hypothetical protein
MRADRGWRQGQQLAHQAEPGSSGIDEAKKIGRE